ncbi:MAG: D-glycero-D-manno-heptose 1,7-bisphosphate phosphatase [Verrucomicrobiota bacterium]|jgi:D-glycero-D-manno-heptose 1,7-bisphosphate phosphatase
MTKSAAVFLDRDGTIMRDVDYCGDPKNVEVFNNASPTLRKLKERGYKLIVITNQSGIGRGYFSEAEYRAVEDEVARQVGDNLIDATYYCPHLPADGCKCRKPSAEMVLSAAREHAIDLSRSFFIGDKKSDIECGRRAGVKTVLVKTGYGKDTDHRLADLVASDLAEAADMILNEMLND